MNRQITLLGVLAMFTLTLAGFACSRAQAKQSVPAPEKQLEVEDTTVSQTVVLAGGCFWCTEAVFERVEGVTDVVSGYAGGTAEDANYQKVSSKTTDHAEAILITYDPTIVTYGQLLQIFFDVAHDPTTLNRQGADVGRHYRSAIFYADDAEKQVAQAYIEQLTEAKVFDDPIVTTLEPLDAFYPAEQYHQDYATNNPQNPYIQYTAVPKVKKLEKRQAEAKSRDTTDEQPTPQE